MTQALLLRDDTALAENTAVDAARAVFQSVFSVLSSVPCDADEAPSKRADASRTAGDAARTLYADKLQEAESDTAMHLSATELPNWLLGVADTADRLKYFSQASLVDEGMLAVYRYVADIRRARNWRACDELLRKLSVDIDLGILVATLMATATLPRERLPAWERLYESTREKYIAERGSEEAALALDSLK